MTDSEALRHYVEHSAAESFALLVERHLPLVHSVARRHVAPELAADVTQSVFIELARHARTIKPGTPLVAWLHVVSRRMALNAARSESRRQAREREAALLADMKVNSPSPEWHRLEPLLDEAVASLREEDRAAILLRYFQNQSLREIGAALRSSDDAAQKRVTRAVEQLRQFFIRRGIEVTAAGLTSELSAHAVAFAPAGLAPVTVTSLALSSVTALGTSATTTLILTTVQKSFLTAAALAATIGIAVVESRTLFARQAQLKDLAAQNRTIDDQISAMRLRDAQLRQQVDALRTRLKSSAASAIAPADLELATTLRQWLDRIDHLKAVLVERPNLAVPELALLKDADWLEQASTAPGETDEEVRKSLASLRQKVEQELGSRISGALQEYVKANDQQLPNSATELASFLTNPVPSEWLERYEMLQTGKATDLSRQLRQRIVEPRPVDPDFDYVVRIGIGSIGTGGMVIDDVLRQASKDFSRGHDGKPATDASQLMPYARRPVSLAKLQAELDQLNRHRAATR